MKHMTKFFIGVGCIGLVIAGYAAWVCLTGEDSACLAATLKHRQAILIIGLLASLSVGGFGAILWLQQLRSYGAALIATAAILPGAAALTTVLIFLTTCTPSSEGKFAPFWGSGIAFLTWMILALFCLRFADARYAIPSSFGELRQRLDQLKSRLKVVCPEDGFPNNPCKQMAFIQANDHVQKIKDEFEQRGMPWALARGYINAWTRLHRAEEAMIEFAPKESVIAGALNDVLRLQGSQIDHADDLIARLRQAVDVIDPSAGKYLQKAAANPMPPVIANEARNIGAGGGNIPPAAQIPPDNANVADASCEAQAQARTVLRDVRNAINEFRDGRWNGLIVARNRLIATMIFTGMTAYLLLAIAIIAGAKQPAITAASTFYLVGATIGLLNQLRSLSQSDTAVEDYGLSTARLITMPLFCGLAAIGGVFLMAMPQRANFNSPNISPLTITTPAKLATGFYDKPYYQRIDATGGTPPYHWSINDKPADWIKLQATGDLIAMQPKSAATFAASSTASKKTIAAKNIMVTAQVKDSAGASVDKSFFLKFSSPTAKYVENQPSPRAETTPTVQPLEEIFNLHKNLFGLLLAAVFGLTPGLLFDRLHQQDEKVKADLKSSEATQAKPLPQK